MLSWFDLILILIFALSFVAGYYKGLVATILNLIGIFLGIYLGKLFFLDFAIFLERTFGLGTYLKNLLEPKITSLIPPALVFLNVEQGFPSEFLDLPHFFKSIFELGTTSKIFPKALILKDAILNGVTTIVINIIAFIILFILVNVVIYMISKFLKGLKRSLDLVRFIDGILGATFNSLIAGGLMFIFIVIILELDLLIKNNDVHFFELVRNSYFGNLVFKHYLPKLNEYIINLLKIKIIP